MMNIQFIFTDWNKLQSKVQTKKGYPKSRVLAHPIQLMNISEIETWMKAKLTLIHENRDKPQNEIPNCNSEELWQSKSVFKYYKNPEKRTRSTTNFDNIYAANEKLTADGSVGIVIEVQGTVKKCGYCDAFEVCDQKNVYLENGSLQI